MRQNFIFYDTETSDRDPFFGQIFQLAAGLTDSELNLIDSFDIRSKRLPHILPSPGALLVNGLNPNSLDQAPYTNYEFATKVRQRLLEWSPAITCGYNSFGFDEKCLRSLFYQNLYPPYLTQMHGNSRIDILPLTQAAEHLYPAALSYPLNDRGRTSKKLEHVAPANGFQDHNAHDALGDVEATIHVARLIRSRAPVLWQAALAAGSRRDAATRAERHQWQFIHDHNFGHPITFPATVIGRVHDGRDLLVADLRRDPPDPGAPGVDDLFDGPDRHCRVVKLAEAPLIFSPDEFETMPHGMSWDPSDIEARMAAWKRIRSELDIPAIHAAARPPFEPAAFPESAIYENFDAFDRDQMAMRSFHDIGEDGKAAAVHSLTDPRFRTFARRVIYDNFPQLMGDADKAIYQQAILDRLNREEDVPWVTVGKALKEAGELIESRPERRDELQQIITYIKAMRPDD